jgi:cytochrome P450
MTERLRLHWQRAAQSGQPIDLMRDLKSFALDITIAFSYGQDINSIEQPNNPLQQDIDALFTCIGSRLFSPIKYWRYIRLPRDYAFAAALTRVDHVVKGYVEQTRQLLQAEPERRLKPSNLLEALVVARDEPGSGFEDSHIIGNAMTMVFAGEDTTSNSTAWLINALANAPTATQTIRAELDALYPNHPILPDYPMLQQLPWLDAALNESMRLTPVAPFLGLECTRETVVGDVLLPANTTVMILTRIASMYPAYFPEPEKFLPERWLGDAESDLIKKILPFGGGPRLCPGRFLALAEIKMIVAMLVKNFDIHLQSGVPVEEVFSFTMTPSCLPVTLTPRV